MDMHVVLLKLPKQLHTELVKEGGRRTAKTGTRVSVPAVINDVLRSHFGSGAKKA